MEFDKFLGTLGTGNGHFAASLGSASAFSGGARHSCGPSLLAAWWRFRLLQKRGFVFCEASQTPTLAVRHCRPR